MCFAMIVVHDNSKNCAKSVLCSLNTPADGGKFAEIEM